MTNKPYFYRGDLQRGDYLQKEIQNGATLCKIANFIVVFIVMLNGYFCIQFIFFYNFLQTMSGASYSYLATSMSSTKDVCFGGGMHVKVFAIDFDQTCTTKAILDIYKAREDYPNNKDFLDQKWLEITQFYSSKMEPILKQIKGTKLAAAKFDEEGLRRFLTEVSVGDGSAIDELISSNLLEGISTKRLRDFAENVELMPGVLTVLESFKALNLTFHVISLNFSQKLIRHVLNRHETLPLEIHANALKFKTGEEHSSGELDKKFVSAFDKEVQLQKIVENAASNPGVTIYIGDSFTDLLALLRADVGIIIGQSKSLFAVCNDFGIEVVPLQERENGTFEDEGKKVLFSVDKWDEIQNFMFSKFIWEK